MNEKKAGLSPIDVIARVLYDDGDAINCFVRANALLEALTEARFVVIAQGDDRLADSLDELADLESDGDAPAGYVRTVRDMEVLRAAATRLCEADLIEVERNALLWALTTLGYTIGTWTEHVTHVVDCYCEEPDLDPRCAEQSNLRPALLWDDGDHGPGLAAWMPDAEALAGFARKLRPAGTETPLLTGPDPRVDLAEWLGLDEWQAADCLRDAEAGDDTPAAAIGRLLFEQGYADRV